MNTDKVVGFTRAKTTDEMLRFRLERVSDYSGLKLRITEWSPCDGFTRYQLVEVRDDESEQELGRYLKRMEMYDALNLLNAVYHAQVMKEKEKDKKEVIATKSPAAATAAVIAH